MVKLKSTFNKFMVGFRNGQVCVMRPPTDLTKEDALVLIAYVAVLADLDVESIAEAMREIENT